MSETIVNETQTPEAQAIKNMVIASLEAITKKKDELKAAREMLTDSFDNDENYRTAKREQEKFQTSRRQAEEKIKNHSPQLVEKVDELRDELKELNDALSDYLAEFVRMTGKMEVDKPDGRTYRIVRKFKVSPGQQKLL